VNVEERLIDTLGDEQTWDMTDWIDPVGRIRRAYRRRRRQRITSGIAACGVIAVSAVALAQLHPGGASEIRPAGPSQPTAGTSSSPVLEAQASAAAIAAAQQAAAAHASADAVAALCPKSPGPISPQMKNLAFQAVIAYNRSHFGDFDPATLRRDRVVAASTDTERGGEVTSTCGPLVAARTFVVYTTRTDLLPSQSLSQGVYFVSPTPRQMHVWEQAH